MQTQLTNAIADFTYWRFNGILLYLIFKSRTSNISDAVNHPDINTIIQLILNTSEKIAIKYWSAFVHYCNFILYCAQINNNVSNFNF